MSEGRLEGRVAIVTGAARGTGEVTAQLFAREGARVVLADVLEERAKAVAESLGEGALALHLDVTREEDWEHGVAATLERFGRIDVLVNNAAILEVEAITETSAEAFRRVVDVNLVGPFLGTRAVVEPMKASGGGSIVNVASIDALQSHNGISAYAASKWGLRGLARTAALELGHHAIRVNTVCPGPGGPEMTRPFFERAVTELREKGGPPPAMPAPSFHRRGEMQDVANAILFLASDEGSFISGAELAVDGAHTAGKIFPGAPSA